MLWKSVLFGNSDFDIDDSAALRAFTEGFNLSLSPTAKLTSVSGLIKINNNTILTHTFPDIRCQLAYLAC